MLYGGLGWVGSIKLSNPIAFVDWVGMGLNHDGLGWIGF